MRPTGTPWLISTAILGLSALAASGCDPEQPAGRPGLSDAGIDGDSSDAFTPFPDADAGGGDRDGSVPVEEDAGLVCCLAFPVCAPGEETYDTLAACEAAGDGCSENSVCCSTVYCRPAEETRDDCAGDVVSQEGCDAEGYCVPLGDGEFCAGDRGACELGAHPITADVRCPDGHVCADADDGQRCATRSYESAEACLEEGSYATPAIGALVPCDVGDATLGWIAGFEPSLCCLDTTPADSCEPMDAKGVGACTRFLGWAWDGNACVPHSGCTCEGADCGNLSDEQEACIDAQVEAGCREPDCRTTGCATGSACNLCWGGWACLPDGAVC